MPGHKDVAGNELADALAKAALGTEQDPDSTPTLAGVRMEMKAQLKLNA